MTIEEFKKIKPEYKDTEGEELWNAMENYLLKQQRSNEMLKNIMPLWKTHTLRWLFYRRVPNHVLYKPSVDKYSSNQRCKNCKWGVGSHMMIADFSKRISTSYCPHCHQELEKEPNKNLTHKLYNAYSYIVNLFWATLDKLHIVRSTSEGRYDMMGDEAKYVDHWLMNNNTGTVTPVLRKRKWWEYILIEKPNFNF